MFHFYVSVMLDRLFKLTHKDQGVTHPQDSDGKDRPQIRRVDALRHGQPTRAGPAALGLG